MIKPFFPTLGPKSRVTHALIEWARRQSRRDKHHNPHFIGIALVAIDNYLSDEPDASEAQIVANCLVGRCAAFVARALELPDTVVVP